MAGLKDADDLAFACDCLRDYLPDDMIEVFGCLARPARFRECRFHGLEEANQGLFSAHQSPRVDVCLTGALANKHLKVRACSY